MEKIYFSVDNKPVKVVQKGISSLVSYTNRKSPWDQYAPKQKCVWPSSKLYDNRIMTKRVYGKVVND